MVSDWSLRDRLIGVFVAAPTKRDLSPMTEQLFVVIRRYGPPHDPGKPLEAQLDWEAHRVFMNDLEANGIARLAGPLEGGEDVLLVFRASGKAAVERRLAADPWTGSGILTTTRIARWDLRLGAIS
jgi:uncharacterized protein YciI